MKFPSSPMTSLIDDEPDFNLGESVARDVTLGEVLRSGEADIGELALSYGSSRGHDELRESLAGLLGVGPDNILVTSGAASAIFLLSLTVGDGGEAVIGRPCFPPMYNTVQGLGLDLRVVQSHFETGYRLDVDGLAAQLSARTSLVLLATPQNPSGIEITQAEVTQVLSAMDEICPRAWLLLDETYREATYTDPPSPSFAARGGQVVTCGSLSKAHGVPGLRIGWLTTTDPGLFETLRLAKFNTSVSAGSLDEFLATRVLAMSGGLLRGRREAMREANARVDAWAQELTPLVRYLPGQAGAFCCLRLNPEIFGTAEIEEFHRALARRRTVVARGEWFGDSPNIIRMGPAFEPASKLAAALDSVAEALTESARRAQQRVH